MFSRIRSPQVAGARQPWLGLALLLTLPALSHAQEMKYPLSAVAAPDGSVFIADRNLPGIWKLADGKLEVFFQASRKFRTPLNAVRCVALDGEGRLLAGDSATREVYRFDNAGKPVPLTKGAIGIPMALAVRADGEILVADLETHRIFAIPAAGGEPVEVLAVNSPRGIAVDGEGAVWILSTSSKRGQVLKYTGSGEPLVVIGPQTFQFPHNIVLDAKGLPCVTDGYGKAVLKIQDGKASPMVSGPPLVNPVGLSRIGEDLLVVDPRANEIFRLSSDGKLTGLKPSS